jgi:8-amino-7-oxononanoate synthase
MSLAPPLQPVDRTHVRLRGRKLSYFSGCDYFRLSSHPRVLAAARRALASGPINVAASRITTGNHPLYGRLEAALEKFFAVPAATLAANGSAPNLMAAQALAGRFTHALLDDRTHACVADAAQLLRCPILRFGHRSPADLARVLNRLGRCVPILLTDGMFSQDGSVAPLAEYLRILPASGRILVDDAHGAGVLGARGRGAPEHCGVSRARVIQTITLSKAFGVFGGAVLGPAALKRAIIQKSRAFIGSTPLPPPLAAAALASVNLLRQNPQWRSRLHRRASALKQRLRNAGIPLPDHPGPIIQIVPRNSHDAARLSRRLLAASILPPFIDYPGGPPGGSFRFAISSEHTPAQLDALATALIAVLQSRATGRWPLTTGN